MKTSNLSKIFMLLFVISAAMVSCSKEISPTPSGNPSAGGLVSYNVLGNIVDYGLVNSDTRMMKMAISPQYFNLYDSDGNLSRTAGQVQLSFYVNDDGFIPEGDYSFSETDSKTPFSFDAGDFLAANSVNADPIVRGAVKVSRSGENYMFAIQADLASGMKFSESYHGSMLYADSK
jgi:hypothetical protein